MRHEEVSAQRDLHNSATSNALSTIALTQAICPDEPVYDEESTAHLRQFNSVNSLTSACLHAASTAQSDVDACSGFDVLRRFAEILHEYFQTMLFLLTMSCVRLLNFHCAHFYTQVTAALHSQSIISNCRSRTNECC